MSAGEKTIVPARPAGRTSRALRRTGKWAAAAAAVAFVLGILASLCLALVPLPPALFEPPPTGLELVDRHGTPLRAVRAEAGQFSRSVTYAEIPPALVNATLAAEDKRFWDHHGVDWRATLRAAWSCLRHRRVVSGASTITQQLVKQADPRPRTVRTKIIEATQALRLEQVWDKQRILTEYLNRVDYGNLNAGCAQAAQFYFAKPVRELSVAECALLAGLPQSPSRLNPRRNLERARQRQQWILQRMRLNHLLTAAEFDRACVEPLRLNPAGRSFAAPHFVDLLLARRMVSIAGGEDPQSKENPPRATGRIDTTLDLSLNGFVARTLRDYLARLQAERVRNGAVVIIDNPTGDVLALVGSEDYFAPAWGQVNGAWAPRSAGSTLKPFTYLLAFERGATPATVIADVPTEFPTPTGVFSPVNYNRRCQGPVRCRLALANSLNIPAVKVLEFIGGPQVLLDRLQAAGLTTLDQPADFYGLGLTIGNAEVRLLELANAYACLARLGEFMPCNLVRGTSPAGLRPRRLFDRGAAWLVADILSDNDARAAAFGPDSSLRFDFPVACKTGTSSDFRDNWALGYTPEFTVGVWVGNFDGTPMERVSGVTGAAPILHDIFEHLHRRFGTTWHDRPAGIVERPVHPLTGKRALQPTSATVLEKFLAGSLPPPESAADYDAAGRVRLPGEYRDWLAGHDNWLGDRVTLDDAGAGAGLRIITPLPGTTFFLDPDLPDSARRIRLKAVGAAAARWASDSLTVRQQGNDALAELAPGRHHLAVSDPVTGERRETWILVKKL